MNILIIILIRLLFLNIRKFDCYSPSFTFSQVTKECNEKKKTFLSSHKYEKSNVIVKKKKSKVIIIFSGKNELKKTLILFIVQHQITKEINDYIFIHLLFFPNQLPYLFHYIIYIYRFLNQLCTHNLFGTFRQYLAFFNAQ